MIPQQTFENYPVFGDNATKVKPDDVKYAAGFQQSDVLPAEWVNWAWNKNTQGITELQAGIRSLEAEINSVLTAASITPDVSENAQLTAAINYLISTGNSATTTKLKTARTIGLTDADGTNTGTSISFDGSADKTLKLPSTIKASLSGTATNATCFAGYTYAQAKADIRSGLTGCTGTVTSVKLYCGTTCKGEITSSGSICLGANAFNSTGFTTCTGTVTSIKFQCASTDKCTITGSGTINLSANAWNANATISTTTYPGACCTGTLTSSSGCAYDSARLGGTAASSYLKTTGCAADSAKLGGTAASGYQKAVTEVTCCGIRFTVIYKTSHQMMFSFENATASTINTCCMGKYMACFLASQGVKCLYGTMQGTARQGCGNTGDETWQLFWNGCAWGMCTPAQYSSRCLYRRVGDGEYAFQLESCGAGVMTANYITF